MERLAGAFGVTKNLEVRLSFTGWRLGLHVDFVIA